MNEDARELLDFNDAMEKSDVRRLMHHWKMTDAVLAERSMHVHRATWLSLSEDDRELSRQWLRDNNHLALPDAEQI